MMWLYTCIGNWIISLCMWSWLTVWCLSYCNMSAGVMSVPSDLVLVACFITVWWTDSHSLYVFTLMGTYQAGPSPTKSHGEVSNTHLMWTEEESLNIYSIAPHINEFPSSWGFFFSYGSLLNFVSCSWKKTVVFMGLWKVRKNEITFLFLSNLLLNPIIKDQGNKGNYLLVLSH